MPALRRTRRVSDRRPTAVAVQCRYQVSVTAGTVMHKTRLSLRLWFWAAYLMATGTPGMSARQLQRQLVLSRYDTAWTMLHKLRRAMVAPDRGLLTGEVEVDEVEVDEFEIGGVQKGRSGGRSAIAKAASGIIAVEVRGNGSGRVRIELIDDASAATLSGFIERTVAPGAIVHTDGWQGNRNWPARASTTARAARPKLNVTATPTRSCCGRTGRSRTSSPGSAAPTAA